MQATEGKVKKIIVEQLGVEEEDVTPEACQPSGPIG